YPQRTRWNVRDSDGTLILTCGASDRGTAQTVRLAEQMGRPHLVLNLDERPRTEEVRTWAEAHRVAVLNVAGPREASAPGVYERAAAFLRAVLSGGDAVTSSAGTP
ncbi:MAG TPA: putative molybdenum carrier protein, partial [Gemmataceae bacterium]|nr:putative molybdenum carrier protein [Gemmataceae bacterium]